MMDARHGWLNHLSVDLRAVEKQIHSLHEMPVLHGLACLSDMDIHIWSLCNCTGRWYGRFLIALLSVF